MACQSLHNFGLWAGEAQTTQMTQWTLNFSHRLCPSCEAFQDDYYITIFQRALLGTRRRPFNQSEDIQKQSEYPQVASYSTTWPNLGFTGSHYSTWEKVSGTSLDYPTVRPFSGTVILENQATQAINSFIPVVRAYTELVRLRSDPCTHWGTCQTFAGYGCCYWRRPLNLAFGVACLSSHEVRMKY
jgi:hypothetical protein